MNGVEDKITRKIYIMIGLVLCFTAVVMYRVESNIRNVDNFRDKHNILDENIKDNSSNNQNNQNNQTQNVVHNYTSNASGEVIDATKENDEENNLLVEVGRLDIRDYTDDTYWNVILVNKKNTLPVDRPVTLGTISNGKQVDYRIVEITNQMLKDAKAAGISLIAGSTYRSYSYQQKLFDKEVKEWEQKGYSSEDARIAAGKEVAYPGTSEHQLGLAIDFLTNEYMVLDQGFENTQAFKWLEENAHKYGYILRYMKGKEDKTGIIYEPWHWRYLGVELAKEVKSSGLCYEEFLGKE